MSKGLKDWVSWESDGSTYTIIDFELKFKPYSFKIFTQGCKDERTHKLRTCLLCSVAWHTYTNRNNCTCFAQGGGIEKLPLESKLHAMQTCIVELSISLNTVTYSNQINTCLSHTYNSTCFYPTIIIFYYIECSINHIFPFFVFSSCFATIYSEVACNSSHITTQ